ncbi:HrpB1 family type III secretion system apparatus protein [Paraburkholderia sp. NMBU_R16]|uniref:HrpB1 family type III secretion system apparatus protein n=1 Tax=Paraburkholderia sp. NMBU_R16 TaxID=2698676 RepID=UPI0020B89ACC|nr:HrpB1 family type III secretion system apparatus protein [Paraburkholderia sp. NMBU_R16]
MPTYLNCSPDVVGGLIETVTAALLGNSSFLEGEPEGTEDIEMVLDALKILRPKVAELETFTGLLLMRRGQWDEAIHLFSGLVARSPSYSYGKALLAFCLSFKGDPNWRQAATEAMRETPDRTTRALVRALAARDDLNEALRAHQNGAPFEVPVSIARLAEDLDDESDVSMAAVPGKPAAQGQSETVEQSRFLRL